MKTTTDNFGAGFSRRLPLRPACLLLLALGLPTSVYPLGFRIPNLDAEATARGNAFVATADNPAAIYYNPAGIRQIEGTEAELDFHFISVNSHFEGPAGNTTDSRFGIQPAPQFYAVVSPKDRPYSFGLGVFTPFGLAIEWPEDAPFRTMGLEGRLLYATVNPVVAWQPLPSLSVAAGPTLNYAQFFMRRGIGLSPGDEFDFRGDGFAGGGRVGLRWQPHEKWAFGATYTSPTTVNFDGNSRAKPYVPGANATSVEMDFPQFATAGISFRPTAQWNIEIGADWTDWDTVTTVKFKGTAFGDVPFALNWKSTFMANLGVSRYFENGYWIAAGYFYSPNSTTDRDFSPLLPDTNLHVASLGFGHRGQHWCWALSGQIISGPAREINNGTPANGSFEFFNQAVNVSLAYRF